jgi:hypothetical protein
MKIPSKRDGIRSNLEMSQSSRAERSFATPSIHFGIE